MLENDPFAVIREAHTSAGNYDLNTDSIIARLRAWQSVCSLRVIEARHDQITIAFETLPTDLDTFVKELCDFCPDLVDQGAGSLPDVIKEFEESGQPIPAKMMKLIEGVNFEDDNFALEIVKRTLQQDKKIRLWWD
jgi:hypothetical protein